MSSGHASHKGPGIKQSHDTGQLDSAATTPASDPQDLIDEGEGYPFNAQGTEVNPAATERPDQPDGDRPEAQDQKS
jgi:hypothetical protein